MEDKINKLQSRLNQLVTTSKEILDKKENSLEISEGYFDSWEPDASPIAWCYYTNLYVKSTDGINNKYNFCEKFSKGTHKALPYHKSNSRISVYLNTDRTIIIKHNDNDIEVSGDCCFNFNVTKVKTFKKIIEESENEYAKSLLNIATKMHHSPFNFALMPINGGMNKIKGDGEHGLDRFDLFISALDLFFENKENPVSIKLIAEYETSYDSLITFLNNFKKLDNYCELFYPELLSEFSKSKKILERLKNSGKKPIKIYGNNGKIDIEATINRIIEYIELAIDFWKAKADYYDEQHKKHEQSTTLNAE